MMFKTGIGTMLVAGYLFTPGWASPQQRQATGEAPVVKRKLAWVDRRGKVATLAAPARAYGLPRLSPDRRRVAVEVKDAKYDLWIYDIPGGSFTQLTSGGDNRFPLWTPDGKRIAFGSSKPGPVNVFWKPAEGGQEERLTVSEYPHGPQSFSADGRLLSFYEIHPVTGRDIWMLPLGGERKPWAFVRTSHLEGGAVFSPDGRWIAYVSDETGRFQTVWFRFRSV